MPMGFEQTFNDQKQNQFRVKSQPLSKRVQKLVLLKKWIDNNRPAINHALFQDFRKSSVECDLTETHPTLTEAKLAIRRLKKWTKRHRVGAPLALFSTKNFIQYEPKGVVLIISPWNYPFSLMVNPLISAIAAGNCAILKPSELAPATAQLISKMVADLFSPNEVAVFEGDVGVSQELLKLPFDHIFFTGSTRVGKVVMEAASKHLTSVTLELGGKSPVIIDKTAHIPRAANRLAWGKFLNAGQTCVAPDYILVDKTIEHEFVTEFQNCISKFYGPTEELRKESPDFARIIDARNLSRVQGLIEKSVQQGATLVMGHKSDPGQKFLAPTILTNVRPDSAIMTEEIFGPVMPIMSFDTIDKATEFVRSHDKPLALYIFSSHKKNVRKILSETTSGGVCVNDVLIHLANHHLPFGGVGSSGFGSYHGFHGFKAFSHERGVMIQRGPSFLEFLYPPYKDWVKKTMLFITKWL